MYCAMNFTWMVLFIAHDHQLLSIVQMMLLTGELRILPEIMEQRLDQLGTQPASLRACALTP